MTDISAKITRIDEIVTSFDEFEVEDLLDEIQGNILKSHGRNHGVHLFVKFTCDELTAKKWISSFAHKYVTSALAQAEDTKLYRNNKDVPGKIFANLFLTYAGYAYLGYKKDQVPKGESFQKGMKHSAIQEELGDDVNQWEQGFQNEIHALILLASDRITGPRSKEAKLLERKNQNLLRKQPALLTEKAEKIRQELHEIADIVHEEIGYVLRSSDSGAEIEHFGFRDGVSQPLFLKRDIDEERKNSDFSNWDPRAPLSLVLCKDPLGTKGESYGSFFVYRKLEQNVKAWEEDINDLAEKLKGSEPAADPHLAGAYTMGRFQDGTPVVKQKTSSGKKPEENNFNYKDDLQGLKCPFQAHARKVNPRGDTEWLAPPDNSLEKEKMNRIVRRAINYGHLPSEKPEKDAGLLFMCFQADLEEQFNLMQKKWAKDPNFVKAKTGTDVVIGVEKRDEQGKEVKETYKWPTKWNESEQTEVDFTHWVTMKGGEYFFAPSMSFLKSFASAPRSEVVFRGVPKEEIQAAQKMITELRNYQQLNWAIGLDGDTLQPDKFLAFFNQRNLSFKFYLLNQFPLGRATAYDENITTLNQYVEDIRSQEIEASEYKIAELKEYRELDWSILSQTDTFKPERFVSFFGERDLPFKFVVDSGNIVLDDESSYEDNIKTLKDYISSLHQ